jgi:hypothetical protein
MSESVHESAQSDATAQFVPAIDSGYALRQDASDMLAKLGQYSLERGQYDLALHEFASAICYNRDNDAAHEGRLDARERLGSVFDPYAPANGKSDHVGIRRGFFVVANGENVLLRFELTPDGRQAAIDYANLLARDEEQRFVYFNGFIVDHENFDTAVFEYDGVARKIHDAPVARST